MKVLLLMAATNGNGVGIPVSVSVLYTRSHDGTFYMLASVLCCFNTVQYNQ
jgi:hypothetical protein